MTEEDVFLMVFDAVNSLATGQTVLTTSLFSANDWRALQANERKQIGYLLASLVREKVVPLEMCGRTPANHNLYRRI